MKRLYDREKIRLREYIIVLRIEEEKALRSDDPTDQCTAHHRGFIRACNLILKKMEHLQLRKSHHDRYLESL
uniref:Uncharacterized protein n=1 Tax=viral metagenome TaxID=1070528 RepID=A0A6M3KL52_9ZZZZ